MQFDNLEPTDTFGLFLAKMQDRKGIPPDLLHIIYCGKKLDDPERTLAEYGFCDECTVHQVCRLRPAAGHQSGSLTKRSLSK
eukprot:CAMPEP_0174239680 /NCGR_PEP_ID=MMETSP0417-20130205/15620_1 /TAXON_ID=242541 /ORGANISM="Mayorella sp, Strain BSH-02190019" /LENGTH=81 /DNA_ID=CAMNT_0015318643 /DNA_START=102 /DNA_END=347 /DNA_ORIENTATION=+